MRFYWEVNATSVVRARGAAFAIAPAWQSRVARVSSVREFASQHLVSAVRQGTSQPNNWTVRTREKEGSPNAAVFRFAESEEIVMTAQQRPRQSGGFIMFARIGTDRGQES
jgi:hypothetical protein